jgi:nitrite reductase/ring-hydroxylating ferredoxin subunit
VSESESHSESVGGLKEFPEGKIRRRFVKGREIAVVLWEGRFYAFSNRCPHADFQMHFGFVEDDKLHCPIHYAEFELATGKAVFGPAGVPDIETFAVEADGESVRVTAPRAENLTPGPSPLRQGSGHACEERGA